jgi:hypothetical protein
LAISRKERKARTNCKSRKEAQSRFLELSIDFTKKKVEKTSKTDAGHPVLGFPSLNSGSQRPTFVSSIIETGIKYLLKIKIKIFSQYIFSQLFKLVSIEKIKKFKN